MSIELFYCSYALVKSQMGISHCLSDCSVPKHLLHHLKRGAFLYKPTGKGMSQSVENHFWAWIGNFNIKAAFLNRSGITFTDFDNFLPFLDSNKYPEILCLDRRLLTMEMAVSER